MRPLRAVADMYDCCLGRPPLHLRRAFQRQIKEVITGCEREDGYTWPMVFKVLGVPCPSRPTLLVKLERAVRNSEEKEYHRAGMDFSRLQKSGVSKILLKGESYSAPPNMKKVRMHERWRFSGHDRVYLDASCLAYDFAGKVIKVVDYQHRRRSPWRWPAGAAWAVTARAGTATGGTRASRTAPQFATPATRSTTCSAPGSTPSTST